MRAKKLVLYIAFNLFAAFLSASMSGRNTLQAADYPFIDFRQAESGSVPQTITGSAVAPKPGPQALSGMEAFPGSLPFSSGSTSPHSFEVAPLVFRFEYEEPSIMSEKGYLLGIAGRYRFTRRAFMVEGSIEYAAGNLDYEGSTWNGTPVEADTEDYLLELRSVIGPNIRPGNIVITPFIGLALRYWNDTIESPGGYEREISYLYSPIGVKFSGPISPDWSWSFSGEYDLFWQGWVVSHLSDVSPRFNDPENNQEFGDGYGLRFSLELRNQISPKLSWYIQPFFRYWDVEDSDDAILINYPDPGRSSFVYEPANRTTAYGVSVGFAF